MADRYRAASHARSLAHGILSFANDHDAEAPGEQAWRQALLDSGLATPDIFTPPGAERVEQAFRYIRPTPEQIRAATRLGTSDVVVLYDDPDLWGGEGGHVVYLDTRIEWIEGSAFRDRIRRLRNED